MSAELCSCTHLPHTQPTTIVPAPYFFQCELPLYGRDTNTRMLNVDIGLLILSARVCLVLPLFRSVPYSQVWHVCMPLFVCVPFLLSTGKYDHLSMELKRKRIGMWLNNDEMKIPSSVGDGKYDIWFRWILVGQANCCKFFDDDLGGKV